MEKREIIVTFDNARLDALEFYLKKENTSIQKRMDEALRQLYESTVPEAVREYLDSRAAPPSKPKRPSRPLRESSRRGRQNRTAKLLPRQGRSSLNEKQRNLPVGG